MILGCKKCEHCVKSPHMIYAGKRGETMANADVYVDPHNFIVYAKGIIFRVYSSVGIEINGPHCIDFDTTTKGIQIIPYWIPSEGAINTVKQTILSSLKDLNILGLRRITEQCRLQIDGGPRFLEFKADFTYGYNFLYKGELPASQKSMVGVCIPTPHLKSALQRSIDREHVECEDFIPDVYRLNMIKLDVPEGHDNPMKYKVDFSKSACELTVDEEHVAHNICRKAMVKDPLIDDYDIVEIKNDLIPEHYEVTEGGIIPCGDDFSNIDCGLVSILLAICYDVRTTSDEPTCVSAWTRNSLSALLTHFDNPSTFFDTVVGFLRRSLIYPYYRSYKLGCLCVRDAIAALETRYAWILKQLVKTHELFVADTDFNRQVLNQYYLDDYIVLMYMNPYDNIKRFKKVAEELKNVLTIINKDDLRLEILAIESSIVYEIVNESLKEKNNAREDGDAETDDDDDEDTDDENTDNDHSNDDDDESTNDDKSDDTDDDENDDTTDDDKADYDKDDDKNSKATTETNNINETASIERKIDAETQTHGSENCSLAETTVNNEKINTFA